MQPITARGDLRIARHLNHTGYDDRTLRRAAARGRLTRLRSGAYVATEVWAALTSEDRRRLEVAAAHEIGRDDFVASHRSAAALWEVPSIRRYDGLVHARVSIAAGTRTEHGFRKHAVRDTALHVVAIHGIPCTTLERTILDLAATEPFAVAVVAADWALRKHTDREALARALDELSPRQGRKRIEAVLDFADPAAGSPGESWSRVQMKEAGLTLPLLQVPMSDRAGLIGIVDFFWPELGVIGEFDGKEKFVNRTMLRGRTPSEVLDDEKHREDRLRATGPRVTRWVWSTLLTPGGLAEHLRAAGVR